MAATEDFSNGMKRKQSQGVKKNITYLSIDIFQGKKKRNYFIKDMKKITGIAHSL